ncbi:MAG: hypothetical protein HND57_08120 [Planctomycetes bacterium]|nr:hypothetical protein [Planctomycetota bacterium]
MDLFNFRDGELCCEDVPVADIAHQVGTPAYIYSGNTLAEHFRRLANAFAAADPVICYSIKSCANLGILRLLADRGAGVDVVSGGELHRARSPVSQDRKSSMPAWGRRMPKSARR